MNKPPGFTTVREDLTIVLPPKKSSAIFNAPPSLSAITPGRSLTASVFGRGPTPDVRDLFTMSKKLGAGQYGTAYLCTEKSTGKKFACKTIARSSLISEEDVADIRTEVSIMYRLAGRPHVVKIHSTFEDRYYVHIVMELCSGGELFDRINERMARYSVPYSEKDAAVLARQIVGAVEVCHLAGVVHRDLKPENFLFTSRDESAQLKVTDFGMAATFRAGVTFDRACGSAMYMAPEVIRLWRRRMGAPKVPYGPAVDVFGAGVILFILLSGEHPFPTPSYDRGDSGYMRAILKGKPNFKGPEWQKISHEAQDLIRSMLQMDPQERPTASEILQHPWILNAPDVALDLTVVKRFKQFIDLVMLKRVKKVAMRSMAENLDEAGMAHVRALVETTVGEKKGFVSVQRLGESLQQAGANQVAQEIQKAVKETGVNQSVTFEHRPFLDACTQLVLITKQENLFKGLSLFDDDLSGFISEEELRRACREFHVDSKSLQELLQEVQRDNRGRLDYNEFVAMMRKETGGMGRKAVETSLDLSVKDMHDAATDVLEA